MRRTALFFRGLQPSSHLLSESRGGSKLELGVTGRGLLGSEITDAGGYSEAGIFGFNLYTAKGSVTFAIEG